MTKLNYKNLYTLELKAYRELYDKLEKENIIIEHNMISGEVKVHNIALEKCKKEYNDLETYFEELSDNYSTLQVKYDDLLEKYSFSETLRHILVKYIINN